ncbi:hypothetical protein ACLKA7_004635 [Drosophila subpalustris]
MSCDWRIWLLLQLLVLLMQSWETKGDCCTPSFENNWCDDGTKGTPCCGYDRCNIFCCNCRCRVGKRRTPRKKCDNHRGHSHKRKMMEDNYDRHNQNNQVSNRDIVSFLKDLFRA